MKDSLHKLWIIDFAVSNYLPRIVDLAVTSCNLCLNPESIDKCINIALEQYFESSILKDYYVKHNIKSSIIDMKEEPICKVTDNIKVETDVGSCDRWKLLYNMLKGSYTESDTSYGNFESDRYEFMPNLFIKYELNTDTEKFEIEHKCAFINTLKTRLIPIQENSPLTR